MDSPTGLLYGILPGSHMGSDVDARHGTIKDFSLELMRNTFLQDEIS